jgi:hypothetical protein
MPAASKTVTAEAGFASPEEFRKVIDGALRLMSEDPEIGPRLRCADVRQRFVFTDVDLLVNVRAGRGSEANLVWEWSAEVNWEPRVILTMSSAVAHRYFLGRENVAVAVARRRIRAAGDKYAAVAVLPLLRPLFARYRAMIAAEYPHLQDALDRPAQPE